MTGELEVVTGSLIRSGGSDNGRVLAGDPQSPVARAVVNHQDFVAGVKGLKGPPQAEFVVAGVQDGGDGRHCEHAMGTQFAGRDNSSKQKGRETSAPSLKNSLFLLLIV